MILRLVFAFIIIFVSVFFLFEYLKSVFREKKFLTVFLAIQKYIIVFMVATSILVFIYTFF